MSRTHHALLRAAALSTSTKRGLLMASLVLVFFATRLAFAQENETMDEPPATQTLEEQIAELRARIEQMTAPTDAAGQMTTPAAAGPSSNVSTVPASVFGNDATTGTHSWVGDGLTFISKDGNFKTHLGGVVQLDAVGFGSGTPGITAIPGGGRYAGIGYISPAPRSCRGDDVRQY